MPDLDYKVDKALEVNFQIIMREISNLKAEIAALRIRIDSLENP